MNAYTYVYILIFSRELLRLFVNPELIKWSGLCEIYEKELRATEVFTASTEEGCKRWADLRNRVVEHVSFQDPKVYFFTSCLALHVGSVFIEFHRISESWLNITQKSP